MLQVAHYERMEALIAVSISLVGFFGVALFPVSLELAVECTFPVAEATSAGLLIMSGYDARDMLYIHCLHHSKHAPILFIFRINYCHKYIIAQFHQDSLQMHLHHFCNKLKTCKCVTVNLFL
jgi:hypothetical protein